MNVQRLEDYVPGWLHGVVDSANNAVLNFAQYEQRDAASRLSLSEGWLVVRSAVLWRSAFSKQVDVCRKANEQILCKVF